MRITILLLITGFTVFLSGSQSDFRQANVNLRKITENSILGEPNAWTKQTLILKLNPKSERSNEWINIGLEGQNLHCVAIDPNDGTIIYAGGQSPMWKTTNGGITWFQPSAYAYPFKEIVIDHDVPNGVWGIWGMGTYSDGVFLSTDGGYYWNPSYWMLWGDALAMCATIHDFLYAAALDSFSGPGPGIWRTTDHGANWYGGWLTDYSFRSLAIQPTNPDICYAGTEQGKIFKTTNGGLDWQESFTLSPLWVSSLCINPFQSNIVFAAIGAYNSYSDGIYRTTNSGISWNVVHWMFNANALAMEYENPEVIYAGSRTSGITRTLNAGLSWTTINNGLTNSNIQYLAIDPLNRRKIYAVTWGGGIFRYDWSPDVSIALDPDSTAVHPGGLLSFSAQVCNNTTSIQTCWAQVTVLLQNGSSVPIGQPVQLSLQPSICYTYDIAYPVPAGAPEGDYRLRLWLGTRQNIWDVASFQFAIAYQ